MDMSYLPVAPSKKMLRLKKEGVRFYTLVFFYCWQHFFFLVACNAQIDASVALL